jgi:predicted ATPase/DNA-binding winged helix-turn-helix (wHTH) protein
VPLGSRAIDILLFLISSPGELRTNDEIIKHVWPHTFVDETNLRVHVSALRKALGDTKSESRFIANIPGRGYTFVGQVSRHAHNPAEQMRANDFTNAGTRIFGRSQNIEYILAQLQTGRLVTVTGPGGIGKSTVVNAVAERLGDEQGVIKIQLSDTASGDLVPTVIASSLGIKFRSENVLATICATIETKPTIFILDGCEHVIDEVAQFVEVILQRSSTVRVLATSREPLRTSDERVHRILPLEIPDSRISLSEALDFPSIQLFVERADACLGGYKLSETDLPVVIDICSRLDGIALAIELAAGRLESMSLTTLAASLNDCFRILSRGRRTALPRHQTLRAALDWSYFLLSPAERRGLAELSVFRGRFTISAAAAVLTDDAYDLVAALVAKSLVVADTSASREFYRLLDTTRIYATEKLAEIGAYNATMEKLGNYLWKLLDGSSVAIHAQSTAEAFQDFGYLLPALRSCLDWALTGGGNRLLGARLTVAALPLFFKLSLYDECISAVTASIEFLNANPEVDEASRMKLYTALGWPQIIAAAIPGRGVEAWTASARIAEKLGDVDHQLRAIWGLWVDAINRAEPKVGLCLTEKFAQIAASSTDPADAVIGERIKGATCHWLGRHADAEKCLRTMLQDYDGLPSSSHSIRYQFDQKVTAHIILSRCEWFLGREQKALRDVASTLAYAEKIGHYPSLTNALAESACPLALMSGDDNLAEEYISQLKEHTRTTMLDVWHTYAVCFEAELLRRRGDNNACLRQVQAGLNTLRQAGFVLFETMFVTTEARALSAIGRNVEAETVLGGALSKCENSGEAWCLPELLRARAEIQLKLSDHPGARASFDRARQTAVTAGALGLLKMIDQDMVSADIEIVAATNEWPPIGLTKSGEPNRMQGG